jgi:hypothetical protein
MPWQAVCSFFRDDIPAALWIILPAARSSVAQFFLIPDDRPEAPQAGGALDLSGGSEPEDGVFVKPSAPFAVDKLAVATFAEAN